MRIVAMMSGGDWADASVEHIVVSPEINMDKVKEEYDEWMRKVRESPHYDYTSFIDWLKQNYGARDTSPEEVEEFWEY